MLIMKKVFIILFSALAFCPVFSQQIPVSGNVKSDSDPYGIPGVNVFIKGTTKGTITNLDGNYSIEAKIGDTLQFSFVGYKIQEIAVGSNTIIDIVLVPELVSLDEVVVTALGIKREEKALGFSIQDVDGEAITKSRELDITNALTGKVAGVTITQGGGGVGGGGSRIVIRGETSLAGNNKPLYIIDGFIGDINDVASDDIESISVLKGPSAAALYGSRGANGVILVTTKKSGEISGFEVHFNTNISFQTPLVLPEYQNSFGQGQGGEYSYFDGNGGGTNDEYKVCWGPAFDGELRHQYTGLDPWVAYPDNVKDFYQVGHTYSNNIAFSNKTENGSFRISYTNSNQSGMVPNTDQAKNIFDLNSSSTFFNKLKVNANAKYKKTHSNNNRDFDPRLTPRNVNFDDLKNYWVPGLEGTQQFTFREGDNDEKSDNPYWVLYESPNTLDKHTIIGNISGEMPLGKYFGMIGRIGTKMVSEEKSEKRAPGNNWGELDENGSFTLKNYNTETLNGDYLLSYENRELGKIAVKTSLGGSFYTFKKTLTYGKVERLMIPYVYTLDNYKEGDKVLADYSVSKKARSSLYAFANIAYNNYLFLDLTARNDWSSTLPPKNNSYFFPSFSLSGIVSDMVEMPKWVNFAKVRASLAQVGNDAGQPYKTSRFYEFTGDGGLSDSPILNNEDLKPEISTGYEFGGDFRFLNNRLGFDITYYHNNIKNQIFTIMASDAGGESVREKNSGMVENYGWELTSHVVPLKFNDFSWNMDLNWSKDLTYVREMFDEINHQTGEKMAITSYAYEVGDHLYVEDRIDERVGALYGKGYRRVPKGENNAGDIWWSTGGDAQRTEDRIYLGNYNYDWQGSVNNRLSYKNVNLSLLVTLHWGGKFYAKTSNLLTTAGLSDESALNNREGLVPEGSILDPETGEFRTLTADDLGGGLTPFNYWYNVLDAEVAEAYIVDATYAKLREASLNFNIPLQEGFFIRSLQISLIGRNLLVWAKEVEDVDPETYGGAATNNSKIKIDNPEEFGGKSTKRSEIPGKDTGKVPLARSFGLNLNIKF